jgi:hypothetical protein
LAIDARQNHREQDFLPFGALSGIARCLLDLVSLFIRTDGPDLKESTNGLGRMI